jgi:DNA polymerase-3 subunit epsilon
MILGFDTETTGLPDWRAPSDAKHQPHLVQLAMVLLDDDMNERANASMIIKPDGWTIPEEVSKIHGITTEAAAALGVPEKVATDLYVGLLYGTGAQAVAHNVDFDLRIMRIAMLRAGYDKGWQEDRQPESFCTMKAATPIVNLPPTEKMVRAGFNKPKPPKLSECIEFFFSETLVGAHDALVDVRACIRVFHHLRLAPQPVEQIGDVI